MNIFIYDSFLNHKKYDRLLARIETRITDLGLNGKISRLGLTRNVADTVKNELRRGGKTIIAVGNDGTVNQVVNCLAGSATPLGIIPIGTKNNDIAACLGINSAEQACDILSARLLVRLDLGLAKKTYFLGNAAIDNQGATIDISNNYIIEASKKGLIRVLNLACPKAEIPPKIKILPNDGILELMINCQGGSNLFSKQSDQSLFKITKITVSHPRAKLILDGTVALATPVEITVAKQTLNVIVGKDRNF